MDNLLEHTLAAAEQDKVTTHGDSQPLIDMIDGVQVRYPPTHADARGSLVEAFSSEWGWDDDPFCYVYSVTIRPGVTKGWALHKTHTDRYFILKGEMEVILYDVRPDSPTCGQVSRIVMSEHRRCLLRIPTFVWHADYNIGSQDVIMLNMPSRPYDHANPDKYRLPLDTDLIPYSFGPDAKGW